MNEAKIFSLADSLVARQAIIDEFVILLGVAADDVEDLYGDSSLVDMFHVRNPSGSGDSHKDTRLAKLFASMLVDRLLWSRDSGVILDYDPDSEYVRITHPPVYKEES